MLLANAVKRLVPPHELYHFYRKELPLLGGVSNVNLNNTWAAKYHPGPLLEYLRISPTGPMVPLVFNLTTLGDRLHLSMTCRGGPARRSKGGADGGRFPRTQSRPEGVTECGYSLLVTRGGHCQSAVPRRVTRIK